MSQNRGTEGRITDKAFQEQCLGEGGAPIAVESGLSN